MTKLSLLVVILTAFLVTIVSTENYTVEVGKGDANEFYPKSFDANVGDNVRFIWTSGKHSVVQADGPKLCAKSAAEDANATEVYETAKAPKEGVVWNLSKAGPLYYYCGVAKHCKEGGMEGVINVLEEGKTPKETGVKDTEEVPTKTDTPATATASDASSAAAAPSKTSAGNIERPLSIAVIGGMMLSLVNYGL